LDFAPTSIRPYSGCKKIAKPLTAILYTALMCIK
jgi:hypothetical protein